jgi:chitinase
MGNVGSLCGIFELLGKASDKCLGLSDAHIRRWLVAARPLAAGTDDVRHLPDDRVAVAFPARFDQTSAATAERTHASRLEKQQTLFPVRDSLPA